MADGFSSKRSYDYDIFSPWTGEVRDVKDTYPIRNVARKSLDPIQRQTAITAYFSSKQLLLLVFFVTWSVYRAFTNLIGIHKGDACICRGTFC